MPTRSDRAPRLVVLDCDGTLVDSQHVILAAAAEVFERYNLPPPEPFRVRSLIGLSLDRVIQTLMPGAPPEVRDDAVDAYKRAYHRLRQRPELSEPLFPDALTALDALEAAGCRLAVATGKSRRGLDAVLARHGLAGRFASLQTADGNPGKPHPAMLERAMAEAGAPPGLTVMVGDTTFDAEMARAARVPAIGVAWGYHDAAALCAAGVTRVIDAFAELPAAVAAAIGGAGSERGGA